jgi:hypothetical protein
VTKLVCIPTTEVATATGDGCGGGGEHAEKKEEIEQRRRKEEIEEAAFFLRPNCGQVTGGFFKAQLWTITGRHKTY